MKKLKIKNFFKVFRKNLRLAAGVAVGLLLVLSPIIWFYLKNPQASKAAWWDELWMYRKQIVVTNSSGSELTDFQVEILHDFNMSNEVSSGKVQADFDDLRFTDQNGNLLPYWIEDSTSSSLNVWAKLPSIPTSSAIVYMYYGNPSASSYQNGNDTFEFFDDFNDNSINNNLWLVEDQAGALTTTETEGVLRRSGTVTQTNKWSYLSSKLQFDNYRVVDSKIRVNSHSSNEGIMTIGSDYSFIRSVTANDWNHEYYSGSWYFIGDSTISTGGNFINVSIIINSTGISIYEESVNKGSRSVSIPTGKSEIIFHARQYTAGNSLSIDIDDVRVRKYASIQPTAAVPGSEEQSKGPAAYWKFDEGVGSTAYDSTQNRNNGNLGPGDSAPSWQTEDICISGKCLYFDGSNDYVAIGNQSSIKPNLPITISAWIKPNNVSSYQMIFANDNFNTSYYGVIFQLQSNGVLAVSYGNGGSPSPNSRSSKSGSTVLSVNKWYFVTGVIRGANDMDIYINGINDNGTYSGTASSLVYSSNSGYIGYNSGIQPFSGFIDDVKIYPYARSAEQIKADYNSRRASKGASVTLSQNSQNAPDTLNNGLVGYWKMDEASWNGTAGEVIDSSGNGNHGVGVGATPVPGKFANGGGFDGSNDYVSVTDSSSISPIGPISLSAWLKPSTSIVSKALIVKEGSYRLVTNGSGYPLCQIHNGVAWQTAATSTTVLTTGSWQQAVCSYDQTNIKVFVNGIQTGSFPLTTTIADTGNALEIGKDSGGTYSLYSGIIDDLRIYNRALSPAEVQTLYNWAPGPVAHWKFDEMSGTNAYDSSTYGNTGTLGTGTSAPSWTSGKYGGALNFDGVNDYVSANDTELPSSNSPRTIEAWFKTSKNHTIDTYSIIASYGTTSANSNISIGVGYDANITQNAFFISQHGNAVSSSVPVNDNQWHHGAAVFDGTTWKLYVDGVYKNSKAMTTTTILTGTSTRFGMYTNNTFPWSGQIDDVRIYNYARTPEQIVQDMNAGHPAPGSPVGSALGHWKFDEGYGNIANNSGIGGTALNGTLGAGNSAPSWTNNGKYGKALSFDGNDYVNIGNPNSLQIPANGQITMSVWVKISSFPTTGNRAYLIGKGYDNSLEAFFLRVNNSTDPLRVEAGSYDGVNHLTSWYITGWNTGEWHQIVGLYDGTNWKIYFDGVQKSSTATDGPENNSRNVFIGAFDYNGTPSRFLNGLLDDVKIYNFALSEEQIKQDYNQGKAQVLGSLSSGAGNTASENAASQEYCIPGDTAY